MMMTLRGGNVLVDDLLEVVLPRESDDRFDDLTALEQQERRNTANLKLERDVRILVDVQLADGDLARVVGRERVHGRRQPLAGPAPFGPEIDEHRPRRFQDAVVEVAVGDGMHDFVCRLRFVCLLLYVLTFVSSPYIVD